VTDEELAELETLLTAKLKEITALNIEAEDIAERILAERERRRKPATVHELRRCGG
jgi:hypothetical protein